MNLVAKKKPARRPDEMAFAKRLRALREGAGLTLRELAEKAGLNLYAVSKLERGEREPQWQTVLALAGALGVTPDAFLPADEA